MKKGLKLGAASLAAMMVFGLTGCGNDGISKKEGQEWAEKNGYVKEGFAEGLPASVKDTVLPCTTCPQKKSRLCSASDLRPFRYQTCRALQASHFRPSILRQNARRDTSARRLHKRRFDGSFFFE